jgi:hypothetical protein
VVSSPSAPPPLERAVSEMPAESVGVWADHGGIDRVDMLSLLPRSGFLGSDFQRQVSKNPARKQKVEAPPQASKTLAL